MKLISEKELAQLLIDSAELSALYCGGVDNWEGYDNSIYDNEEGGEYLKLREMSYEEITKDYKDA